MNTARQGSYWVTLFLIAAAILSLNCTAGEHARSAESPDRAIAEVSELMVPSSLVAEHKEIHEMLENVAALGGRTGEAAKTVEQKLNEHFKKEEEFAMPELALLRPLAEGKATKNSRAIELSDKLKADLPKMLDEHKAVVAALEALADAAKSENKPAGVEFAEKLKAHAVNEEEILYPAAILVGQALKSMPKN